jgi:hypothetical protein
MCTCDLMCNISMVNWCHKLVTTLHIPSYVTFINCHLMWPSSHDHYHPFKKTYLMWKHKKFTCAFIIFCIFFNFLFWFGYHITIKCFYIDIFLLHFAISFNLVLFTWLFLVPLLSVFVLSFMCALSLNLCIFCVSWFALFVLITFLEFLFMSIHDYVCTYVLHLVVVLHVLCCCVICAMCVTCRFDHTPLKAWPKVFGN